MSPDSGSLAPPQWHGPPSGKTGHGTIHTYIYIYKHVFQRILFIAGSPGSPWGWPWCVGPARGSRGAGDLHGDRGASHGHVQTGGAPWGGDCYGWSIWLAIT